MERLIEGGCFPLSSTWYQKVPLARTCGSPSRFLAHTPASLSGKAVRISSTTLCALPCWGIAMVGAISKRILPILCAPQVPPLPKFGVSSLATFPLLLKALATQMAALHSIATMHIASPLHAMQGDAISLPHAGEDPDAAPYYDKAFFNETTVEAHDKALINDEALNAALNVSPLQEPNKSLINEAAITQALATVALCAALISVAPLISASGKVLLDAVQSLTILRNVKIEKALLTKVSTEASTLNEDAIDMSSMSYANSTKHGGSAIAALSEVAPYLQDKARGMQGPMDVDAPAACVLGDHMEVEIITNFLAIFDAGPAETDCMATNLAGQIFNNAHRHGEQATHGSIPPADYGVPVATHATPLHDKANVEAIPEAQTEGSPNHALPLEASSKSTTKATLTAEASTTILMNDTTAPPALLQVQQPQHSGTHSEPSIHGMPMTYDVPSPLGMPSTDAAPTPSDEEAIIGAFLGALDRSTHEAIVASQIGVQPAPIFIICHSNHAYAQAHNAEVTSCPLTLIQFGSLLFPLNEDGAVFFVPIVAPWRSSPTSQTAFASAPTVCHSVAKPPCVPHGGNPFNNGDSCGAVYTAPTLTNYAKLYFTPVDNLMVPNLPLPYDGQVIKDETSPLPHPSFDPGGCYSQQGHDDAYRDSLNMAKIVFQLHGLFPLKSGECFKACHNLSSTSDSTHDMMELRMFFFLLGQQMYTYLAVFTAVTLCAMITTQLQFSFRLRGRSGHVQAQENHMSVDHQDGVFGAPGKTTMKQMLFFYLKKDVLDPG